MAPDTVARLGPIVFPFLGSEMGGSHVSAFTLARSLTADFGLRCVVLAPADTLIARTAAQEGLEVRATGERPARRNQPTYDLIRFWSRLKILRDYGRGAIIHCNDIAALQSWGVVAKVMRLPVVYHHRSLNRMVLPNRITLKLASAIICISDPCRRNLGFLPDETCSLVLNPFSLPAEIDRHRAKARFLGEYGFPSNTILVGFIANFWRRKRPQFFLETCSLLAERDGRMRFVLFGRGGDLTEDELADCARTLGIGDRIAFAGFRLPPEDNVACLDMLLAPSLQEPFGRTLVEAILLGTPYVATDDGGHSEIGKRWGGGSLVPPSADAGQFAQAAVAILDQSEATVLSPERRWKVAEALSARVHAEKILSIYRASQGGRSSF